jgi:hypothetical protein
MNRLPKYLGVSSMIERFLEQVWQSKTLLKVIEEFNCQSDCQRCGKCVNLAAEIGLDISGKEMEAARQKFVEGKLIINGIEYKPDPRKIQNHRIRRSINALINSISKTA